MKKVLLTVLVSIVLLLSCVTTETEQIRVEDNLLYYSGDDYELFLDLAYPGSGGKHPALICILGSGWGNSTRNPHRSQFYSSIKQAAERGYVAVTIDHRKSGVRGDDSSGYQFPAQLEDIQHASAWLVENRGKYKIDTDRIGIMGWCSGANLAMLHAFSNDDNPSIKVVVNIGGASDLLSEYKVFPTFPCVLGDFIGGTAEEVPDRYAAASPVTYITPDDPPVYSIYGDANNRVPVEHAYILDEKLIEAGVPHRLIIITNGIHFKSPMDDDIWAFLASYLNP